MTRLGTWTDDDMTINRTVTILGAGLGGGFVGNGVLGAAFSVPRPVDASCAAGTKRPPFEVP
jgi:hypothetical protein